MKQQDSLSTWDTDRSSGRQNRFLVRHQIPNLLPISSDQCPYSSHQDQGPGYAGVQIPNPQKKSTTISPQRLTFMPVSAAKSTQPIRLAKVNYRTRFFSPTSVELIRVEARAPRVEVEESFRKSPAPEAPSQSPAQIPTATDDLGRGAVGEIGEIWLFHVCFLFVLLVLN